jgi:hypothetical protein
VSIPNHTSYLAKRPILRSNTETVNRFSRFPNDFASAIALGILSVSAYAVLRWFQIGAMIQSYVESEQAWGDGRSGLANLFLLFASPPMFLVGCVGVFFLHRSFIKANAREQPRWTFLRSAATITLTPYVLWIVFWIWILLQILLSAFLH